MQAATVRFLRCMYPDLGPKITCGKGGAKQIRAGHAANQFNIHMTGTMRFQNPQINDRGMLVLDLRNVTPVTNGRKGEKLKKRG